MNTVINSYFCSIVLYDAEDWTLRKVYHIYLESFEMWCWRRMEKMVWRAKKYCIVSRGEDYLTCNRQKEG
jgi:hypothetical protein